MRDEIAWAKFCAATSAEYPLPLAAKGPPPQGEALNLYSLRILWPVIVSLVRAVPALVYAVCEAVWRVVFRVPVSDGCEFVHQDTPRNRFLVNRLRKVLSRMPPPTPWAPSGDLATLVPFLLFGPDPSVVYERRWLRVHASPAPDGPRAGPHTGASIVLQLSSV